MTKKVLECEYCHQIITENDLRCPNCGASCSDVIKKYKEEQIAIEEEKRAKGEEEVTKVKSYIEKQFKRVTRFHKVASIFTVIIIALILIFMITKILPNFLAFSSNRSASDNFKITIDSYEEYAYYDDFFVDACNTNDGYQKVAFFFTIENISNQSLATISIVNSISLKADNVIVSSSNLTENKNVCTLTQGTGSYSELTGTNLVSGDIVSGYVGFEVPVNAKKLVFTIDDITIEMDNPVYSEY